MSTRSASYDSALPFRSPVIDSQYRDFETSAMFERRRAARKTSKAVATTTVGDVDIIVAAVVEEEKKEEERDDDKDVDDEDDDEDDAELRVDKCEDRPTTTSSTNSKWGETILLYLHDKEELLHMVNMRDVKRRARARAAAPFVRGAR